MEDSQQARCPPVDEHYYQPAGWFLTTTIITTATTVPNPRFTSENMPHISPAKAITSRPPIGGLPPDRLRTKRRYRQHDIIRPVVGQRPTDKMASRPDLFQQHGSQARYELLHSILFGQNSGNEYIPSVLTLSDNRDDVRKRIGISVVKDSLSKTSY